MGAIESVLKTAALAACMGMATGVSAQDNTLTASEKQQGWTLLFDGQTTRGWHNNNVSTIGPAWEVKSGALTLVTGQAQDKVVHGGDILTDAEFENFELVLDWNIGKCGNSGVIINVAESPANAATYYTGPEIQVLDNCHEDGKIAKHRAGNLYDLISSKTESVKPGGEWNHYRIVSDKAVLTVWLNGVEQFSTKLFTPEWTELIKKSKFRDMPDFGKAHKGRIAFQDHGNAVAFRNVKIRQL